MHEIVEKAHQDGFVTTLFGRRRHSPAISSKNFNRACISRTHGYGIPPKIGTVADIIKIAINRASEAIIKAHLKSRILLQVHDELVLEVVKEEIEKVSEILTTAMQNTASLEVPLIHPDLHDGLNWAEAR